MDVAGANFRTLRVYQDGNRMVAFFVEGSDCLDNPGVGFMVAV